MDNQVHTLLKVSLENIKEIVDANTIIGDPITHNGVSIIPISKVKMNFLSGGSEFKNKENKHPFGGGTGGSVNITPVCFLVIGKEDVRILQVGNENYLYERIVDKLPDLVNNVKTLFKDENKATEI